MYLCTRSHAEGEGGKKKGGKKSVQSSHTDGACVQMVGGVKLNPKSYTLNLKPKRAHNGAHENMSVLPN